MDRITDSMIADLKRGNNLVLQVGENLWLTRRGYLFGEGDVYELRRGDKLLDKRFPS